MAGLGEITIRLTDDIAAALENVGKELKATKEACNETRIRQIVREELAALEEHKVKLTPLQGYGGGQP